MQSTVFAVSAEVAPSPIRFRPGAFTPVAPRRPATWPGLFEMVGLMRDNALSIWPDEVYERGVVDRSNAFTRVLVVHDADLVQQIFVTRAARYRVSRAQRHLFRSMFGGQNMIVCEGLLWRQGRRPMDEMFSLEHTRRKEALLAMRIGEMEERIEETIQADRSALIDLEFNRLAWQIMFPITLSIDDDPIIDQTWRTIAANRNTIGRVNAFTFFSMPEWTPAFARGGASSFFDEICGFLRETIRSRRASGERREDLLDRYLYDTREGPPMTEASIVENLLAAFSTGHDTTALAMTWCLYLLANRPDEQEAIAKEIAEAAPDGRLTLAISAGLPRLGAAVKETLRLYPSLPFLAREALEDDSYPDQVIRRGTTVITIPYVMHRHKLYWDDPDAFYPERFSDPSAGARHRRAYIPFGLGPRVCPGRHLANQEVALTLARLIKRFRFTPEPSYVLEPIVRLTLRPRAPLQLRVTRRA